MLVLYAPIWMTIFVMLPAHSKGGRLTWKDGFWSFERNVETYNELRVSGGREFQSLGTMSEKAQLPRDVRTYGMDRTD